MKCIICKNENEFVQNGGNISCPSCHSTFPAYLMKRGMSLKEMMEKRKPSEKITIAPHELIDQYEDIANHFIPRITEKKHFCITDESSLLDLNFEITGKKIERDTDKDLKKIKEIYEVDVSDIKDLNLVQIFERLRLSSPVFNK
jgi:hypothetical protein